VPGKKIDIVPVNPDGHIEEGLKFVLLDDVATAAGTVLKGKGDGTGLKGKGDGNIGTDNRYHKSTEELSGGQRALLGLSFVFAAALHKRSPLYLLDEVRNYALCEILLSV
jgi:ABC-type transport system involved in cytochrome bd biosynthesis fused ATPase/permease subunit